MNAVLQTTNTRDALVAEIRRQILSGDLKPGDPLTESGLATTFDVARPTVRSALQELSRRHLAVRVNSGRSLQVPLLSTADVRDLFFVRTPLELEAVRRIVSEKRSTAGAMTALAQMEDLPEAASWGERVDAHTAFHIALIECAGSERLNRIYPALHEEMQLCLAQLSHSYPRPQDLAREHRDLFDALQSGDVDRALSVMREHLNRAARDLTGN